MNKLITIILTLAFSKGDANMADLNIQMGQRNEINTEWDNHYPISKTENIINNYQNSSAYGVLQKLYHNEENVNIVVLGDSTGNDGNEWVYLFAQEMAVKYPAYTVNYYLWNNTTLVYDLVTVVQNGTDSHSLNIWNSSIVSTITYSAIRIKFKEKVIIPNPDLVLISYGHNEGSLSNNTEKIKS